MVILLAFGVGVVIFLVALKPTEPPLTNLIDFGSDNTSMVGSFDKDQLVDSLARGIAEAEGFNRANTIPATHNNPGDIKVAKVIATFETIEIGWDRLRKLLHVILWGASSYDMNWDLPHFVAHYTADQPPGSAGNRNYVKVLVDQLNQDGFPVTSDITLASLAAGDFEVHFG